MEIIYAMKYPYLDHADENDTAEVLRILKSRPAENADSFQPPSACWFVVVREKDGISGFIVVEWDDRTSAYVAQQIEIEYAQGRPTSRGRVAYDMLSAALHEQADKRGVRVIAPVALHNRASMISLLSQGYEKVAILMERKPMGSPVAESSVKETGVHLDILAATHG